MIFVDFERISMDNVVTKIVNKIAVLRLGKNQHQHEIAKLNNEIERLEKKLEAVHKNKLADERRS